ncbi:MAG: PH domain-containing protein [Candidatus Aenigmatarchaeota archaeon]
MGIQSKYKTSRISFFYNYLFALLIFAFLILIHLLQLNDSFKSIALLVCIPLIAIVLAEPEFVRIYRYYLLEEDNVTMIEGILSKKKVSIPYDQIAGTTIHKTLLGRMLKFGTVKISGFKDEIVLKGIRNPDKVYEHFQEIIKSSKKKKK